MSSSTSVTTKSEIQKTTAGTVAPSLVSAQKYHVIIASVGTEKDAEAMAKQLIEKGYPHAGNSKRYSLIHDFKQADRTKGVFIRSALFIPHLMGNN